MLNDQRPASAKLQITIVSIMKKKKLFFLLHSMNVGGVEKSFLGLISCLPIDKYEIHLGLINKKGGFMDFIPKHVIIHEINCFSRNWSIINDPPQKYLKDLLYQGKFFSAIVYAILHLHFKLTKNRYWFYKYLLRNEPYLEGEYNFAGAYAGPSQMIDFYICNKVHAKVKCGWIHFDITKFGIDKGLTKKLYKNYKKIFIVSKTAKSIFDQSFPGLSNKTEVFYNIVSPIQVKSLAKIGLSFSDNFKGKRLLTVARISEGKRQRIALDILKKLIDSGYNLRWYFIGDGADRVFCEKKAKDLGLSEHAIFMGAITNPYGYMKECDVYVQPSSRIEAYCIAIAEARCFSMPIVATDFAGAREQLHNRPNGIVTDFDEESIEKGIIRALSLPDTEPINDIESTEINNLLSLID